MTWKEHRSKLKMRRLRFEIIDKAPTEEINLLKVLFLYSVAVHKSYFVLNIPAKSLIETGKKMLYFKDIYRLCL